MNEHNKDKDSLDIDQHLHEGGCCQDKVEASCDSVEAKDKGPGMIQKAKDAGSVALESAKDSAAGLKETIVEKASAAGAAIRETASSVKQSLMSAKDIVVERAAHPGEVIDNVKGFAVEKGRQAESLLEKIEGMLAKASEAIESLRDWSLQKAERLDQTLESAQGVVSRAEETLSEAHFWAKDKAVRLGDVMDKTKEAIERSAERLAAQTEELKAQGREAMATLKQTSREVKGEFQATLGGDELRGRIDAAKASIKELEFKIRQLGVDPTGVRMYGTSNPDVQVLRDQIIEEERHVTEFEEQLRQSSSDEFSGPQILPEKR